MPPELAVVAAWFAVVAWSSLVGAALTQNCAFEWEPLTSDADFEYYFPDRRDRCELLLRANGRCGGGARELSCCDASPPEPEPPLDWLEGRRRWGNGWGGWGPEEPKECSRARLGAWAAAELATVAGLRVDRNRSSLEALWLQLRGRALVNDGDSTHRHVSEAYRKRIADLAAYRGARAAAASPLLARADDRALLDPRAPPRAAWFARRVESWENAALWASWRQWLDASVSASSAGVVYLCNAGNHFNVPARLARLERGADGAVAVAYSPLARESTYARAARAALAALEAAGRYHGRARLTILFVDTAVQHFDTDGGEYDAARGAGSHGVALGAAGAEAACPPLRGRPDNMQWRNVVLRHEWRRGNFSHVHVVPWHIATAGLDGLHPGRGDCTHFCYSPQLTEAHARLVLRALQMIDAGDARALDRMDACAWKQHALRDPPLELPRRR